MIAVELGAILPELVVAAACLATVPMSGFVRGRAALFVPATAAVALLAALALAARALAAPPESVFHGTYAVDALASVAKLLVLVSTLLTLAVAVPTFRREEGLAQAPVAALFTCLGAMLVASARDLGVLLLALQMTSFGGYLLVAQRRRDPRALEAALKYFVFGAVSLALMGYGLSLLYGLTGSLDLPGIGAALHGADRAYALLALLLVLAGFAFEIGLVPFHFWIPDVLDGATAPVAGFISVVPKVAGMAALLRFLSEAFPDGQLHWRAVIAVLAAVTMTFGNLAALRQRGLKRLLAYSTIAQAGYVLVAVAAAARVPASATAAAYYLGAYVFMNLGAFAVAAQLERADQTDAIEAYRGLGRRAPFPAAVLALALLSLAGFPPLGGFAGKVLVLGAALQDGLGWLAGVAAVNFVVALVYYVGVIATMYLPGGARLEALPGGWCDRVAQGIHACAMLLLGVVPGWALGLMARFAEAAS